MDKTKKAGMILNQGASLLAAGKTDEAIRAFQKALKLDSKIVAAHFNLGLSYQQKGDYSKAIKQFEQTVYLNPSDFEAFNNLGHLYMTQNLDRALACFQKATRLNPHLSEGFYNLGVAYMAKGQYREAIKSYRTSLAIYPRNSIVLNNLGVTVEKIGKPKEAMKYYKKALKINPQNAQALANIGASLIYIDPRKSSEYFKKSIAADPNIESAAYNLGVALRILGDTRGSIYYFKKALSLNPHFSPTYGQLYHQIRETCDWKAAGQIKTMMKKLTGKDLLKKQLPAQTPFISAVYEENPQRNLDIACAWSRYIEKKIYPFSKPYAFNKKAGPKIRLGYLSNDFRDHATSHLIMGLLRLHNRKKFDIFTYSYGQNDQSSYRREIEKTTHFRDLLNLSHSEAADLIYHDGIDILVDLKGHTSNSRLEIPALKPAPVQVSYLGFPGTSGASFFDYFITDHIVTPQSQTPFFSEKLIFLPHCYQVNDNRQARPKSGVSRKDLFLPGKSFLFCSFNQPYKIGPETFDCWMRILKAVPGSVLCLLDKNPLEVANLSDEAKKRGIDPKRIVFSWPLQKEVHLARLSLCDLALDTFPCNGHTTTSDALWAGLPVVALKGKHFASRVSASILSAIGLPELITHTPAEYEKLAIKLAKSPKPLKSLKEKLIKNRQTYPLFDTKKFTGYLEEAYTRIWGLYQKRQRPETVTVNP